MKLVSAFVEWLSRNGAPWRDFPDPPPPVRRKLSIRARRPIEPLLKEHLPGLPPERRALRTVQEILSGADATAGPEHRLIAAKRVIGALVLNDDGTLQGQIRDLSIDKSSGQIRFALVAFGGFLGFAERYLPIPWAQLNYDTRRDAYEVPFGARRIARAPSLSADDLEWFGQGDAAWRAKMAAHYGPYFTMPFI